MTDQDRAAFEAHARSQGAYEWQLDRDSDGDGEYIHDEAKWDYRTWLAALAHARKQHRELVEAIEEYHATRNRYEAWQHTMSPSEMMLHPVHELQGKVKALAAKHKEVLDETLDS